MCFQIDLEDTFDPDKLEINSVYPEPNDDKPHNLPTLKEDVCPEPIKIPVNVERKKVRTVSMINKTLFLVFLDFGCRNLMWNSV